MDRVFSNQERSFDRIEQIGIAIGEPHHDQRHTGLLYRDDDSGSVVMLHLAWHHKLQNDIPDESYLWVKPTLHPRRLGQIADICRLIWRANSVGGIPFGFSPPDDCFDINTGKYLLGPSSLGLTCATFVLAVFHRAGLPLVVYQSWPTGRLEDREWQERIVTALERSGARSEHVAGVRGDIGSVRFRPEEVAGAATVNPLPAEFANAEQRGRQILNLLRNPRSGQSSHRGLWRRIWSSIQQRLQNK